MKTVKISVPSKVSRTLALRLSKDEYELLRTKAESSGVRIGTLARIVLVQVLKAGIEVN